MSENPFSYISEARTREAADTLSRAYELEWGEPPNSNALVTLLAQAHLESSWGAGTYRAAPRVGPISEEECGLNAKGEPERRRLNNWGAVHDQRGEPGPDSFLGCDHDKGQAFGVYIRAYPTPLDGAKHFIRVATKNRGMAEKPRSETALPEAKKGNLAGYVRAQAESYYFDPSTENRYLRGMAQRAEVIADRLGVPFPAGRGRPVSGSTNAAWVGTLIGAVGLLGALVLSRVKR